MKIWLTLSEAAEVAGRTERTIRNWADSGVLKSPASGWFQRDAVLAAERVMRGKRGRPARPVPHRQGAWSTSTMSVMNDYLEEFRALSEEGDALNARVEREFTKRDQPMEVPIVTDGSDTDLNQLSADWDAHIEKMRKFSETYWGSDKPDPNP